MTPERFERICRVLNRRQPDLSVLLDNVHKPHNLSAIIRSCDAVGVLQAHGVWPSRKLQPTNHTSGGSRKWVQLKTHRTLSDAVDYLRHEGHQIYAAHLSPPPSTTGISTTPFLQPSCWGRSSKG